MLEKNNLACNSEAICRSIGPTFLTRFLDQATNQSVIQVMCVDDEPPSLASNINHKMTFGNVVACRRRGIFGVAHTSTRNVFLNFRLLRPLGVPRRWLRFPQLRVHWLVRRRRMRETLPLPQQLLHLALAPHQGRHCKLAASLELPNLLNKMPPPIQVLSRARYCADLRMASLWR